MELSETVWKKEDVSLMAEGIGAVTRNTFSITSERDFPADQRNRVFAVLPIEQLIFSHVDKPLERTYCLENDFYFYGSGWQSWGFGGELEPGRYQERYTGLIPQWKQYISFPGKAPSRISGRKSSSRKLLEGEFIIYLRWNDVYLVLCSTGNDGKQVLPPVRFYVDRKKKEITCVAYSEGKSWTAGEKICELTVFAAYDYFALKDAMKAIYAPEGSSRFESLDFLNASQDKVLTGGWESWYNHYADINQTLIGEDLEGLGKTENLIKRFFMDNNHPAVFQVDDGWEQGLGQWDNDSSRFPGGMTALASSISEKGYVPGLWVAPFIIDLRTRFAKEHMDWILCDKKGRPVPAGFGQLWGAAFGKDQPGLPYSYYCFDLSQDEVVEYLDSLMEKIINVWGFRYIKLDFLFAGMLMGDYKKGGCGYQWYNRAIERITSRKTNCRGEAVAYLGCGLPFEASYNRLPLSRIGPDTKEAWDMDFLRKIKWSGRPGAIVSMYSTLGHSFWDQAVYINDPDVVFLRYENITLSDKEKELLALVNFLFASQIMHSDDPVKFDSVKEGAFTQHICSLYKLFEGDCFALRNKTSDTFIIWNKAGTRAGFINLSDRNAVFSREELVAHASKGSDDVELKAIVEHSEVAENLFTAEPHSISIYDLK